MNISKRHLASWVCAIAITGLVLPSAVSAKEATTKAKTAAEPIYMLTDPNPATMTLFGTGRLRIPSVRIDMGTSLSINQLLQDGQALQTSFEGITSSLSSGGSLDASLGTKLEGDLNKVLGNLSNGARLDYDVDVTLLGFSGAPFQGLKIANRPLSLGFTVGLQNRGYADINLSSEFQDGLKSITASVPELLSTGSKVSTIAGDANNLFSQTTGLTTNITELTTLSASLILKNTLKQPISPSDITQAQGLIDQVISDTDKVLTPAKELIKTAETTTSTAQKLLDTVKSASSGGVNIDMANDAHLTFNLSGAYPLIENDFLKLSLGTNLKLFVLPTQLSTQQFGLGGDLPLMGQIKISEVSGLNSFDNIEKSLDVVNVALKDVNSLVTSVDKVKTGLNTAKQITTDNLSALQGQANSFKNELSTVNDQLKNASANFNKVTGTLSDVQESLQQDLQNVKLLGSTITPNGAGFGMDFGIEAVIKKNLRFGLFLQNPIVIWQGTENPFEVKFPTSPDGKLAPTINVLNGQSKQVNYNATVPFATQLSAQYLFDDLLPTFKGLYLNSMFEFVANGRTPALTASIQKQWGAAYLGLGGRAGGISPLLFVQTGLRQAGPFGLDLQVGISPTGTGIPGVGALGMAGLGMYFQF